MGTPDIALGSVADNGNAVTIVKQGSGRMIFDDFGAGNIASSVSGRFR